MAHDPEDIEAVMALFEEASPCWCPECQETFRQNAESALDKLTSRGWRPPEKPNADGWIEWGGGECPVAAGTTIDFEYRNGLRSWTYTPERRLRWSHTGSIDDIIAYRVVKAAEPEGGQ